MQDSIASEMQYTVDFKFRTESILQFLYPTWILKFKWYNDYQRTPTVSNKSIGLEIQDAFWTCRTVLLCTS